MALMESRLQKRLNEQRRTRRRRNWFVLAGLALFAVGALAGYVFFASGNFHKASRPGMATTGAHTVNILVMGVDERKGDKGRSDTMMVVTVDLRSKEVSLLSVPRDTRVKIPKLGWDKINHAFNFGGQQLSQTALENLLGIPLDYYVTVNFAGFHKIVDAVGGITVDVPKRMYYEDPYDDLVIDIRPGQQKMDGQTAIKYVRYRDEDGDIGRIDRQQKFLKAMLQQVASPVIIPRIPGIIREARAMIDTDMSTGEMLNLGKLINDAHKAGLRTDIVPGRPAVVGDVSYWLPDIVSLREHIAQLQDLHADQKYLAAAEALADEYAASVPREMKVVETPKAIEAMIKPIAPQPPKPGDKPAAPAPPVSPRVSGPIKVQVINASGSKEPGDKMAALLRTRGFEVAGVSPGAAAAGTVVVSHTTDAAVVNKLTGLPFKYALQVTKDASKPYQVTVVVGKDYTGK